MGDILWLAGRYHLGDNPGVFQDAQYVGYALELPFRKTWIDETATTVKLIVTTLEVETWGAWSGHKVSINGVEVGRLKDQNDAQGSPERFELRIDRALLDGALAGKDTFILRVDLDIQPATPGMADDFILTRVASDGFAAKLGWS